MKIQGYETNEALIKEIAKRVKSRRIALSITQKELSAESRVSVRTLSGFENVEDISFSNLISILRVLRLIQKLNLLIPDIKTNPEGVFNLGHPRQRVTSVKNEKISNWKRGDEE